jgi:tetratricopeptide (TPR) repeat protein
MKKTMIAPIVLLSLSLVMFPQNPPAAQPSASPSAQPATPQSQAAELLKQGRKLHGEGKLDEALAVYQKAMAIAPDYYDVHVAMGSALDVKGDYAEARKHLSRAIQLADTDHKAAVLRTVAISYAFERNVKEETTYGWQAYQLLLDAKKPTDAAGALTELARLQLESGDFDRAAKTYIAGCAVGGKAATTPAEQDLWSFRVEHALARVAARKGDKAEAEKHVAAAKAIFDKKTLPEAQAIYVPYLTGYVAFYLGDYNTALTALQKADQKDPFILALLAQTEEKLADKKAAKDYWTRVLGIYSHNPTNAFARPLAKKALGM